MTRLGVAISTSGNGGTFSLFAKGSSLVKEEKVRARLLSGVVSGVINDDCPILRDETDDERDSTDRLPRTDDVWERVKRLEETAVDIVEAEVN